MNRTEPTGAGQAATQDTPRDAVQREVRPVGTWVVAGFLVVATLVIWVLVAAIFYVRS